MRNDIQSGILALGLAVLLAVPGATGVSARSKDDNASSAYEKLKTLVYDERYSQALEAADRFLADHGDSRYAEGAEFFRCYALQRSTRDYQKPFDCYARFLERFPDGKWADDGRSEYVKLAKRLSDAGDPRGKVALEGLATRESNRDDGDFKLSVLWALMESGDGDVPVDMVTDLLKSSKNPDVRRHVVFMIAELDDPRVLGTLMDVARTDPDADIRRHAIYALSDHADDPKVLDAMVGIMKTEKDADIRRHVLYAIAESPRDDVADILVDVALNDGDMDTRRAATYGLADVETPKATAALEKIAETAEDEELQKAALYALIDRDDVKIVPVLKRIALEKRDTKSGRDLRRAAVWALAEVDDPSVAPTLAEIVRTADDRELQKAALYALAEHEGADAEAALRAAALDKKDEEIAKAAVFGLADMLDDADFFLKVHQESPFAEVRRAALFAAMERGGSASAPALGKLLENEKNIDQRRHIVWALAEIETDESVAILARVARSDPDRDVRRTAVQALGAIGSPAAKKALRELLKER